MTSIRYTAYGYRVCDKVLNAITLYGRHLTDCEEDLIREAVEWAIMLIEETVICPSSEVSGGSSAVLTGKSETDIPTQNP
jgi:hypothetical protein